MDNKGPSDHPSMSSVAIINVHISRTLSALNTLLIKGEELRRRGLFDRFIRCLEFELFNVLWRIAGHITMWEWKSLRIPPAFCNLVQSTALGLLDDPLVVEGISRGLATHLPPLAYEAPRAWWIGFPEREADAPRSQDDAVELERMYPPEVRASSYLHVPPPPPADQNTRAPPELVGNSKEEAHRLLEIVRAHRLITASMSPMTMSPMKHLCAPFLLSKSEWESFCSYLDRRTAHCLVWLSKNYPLEETRVDEFSNGLILEYNTQLQILINAIAAGCTPPCPALLCASTGWTPYAGDVKDCITSVDSLLLTVFQNGVPEGYLDFQVGFRWWEVASQPLTPSERYYKTFMAWWNEQPNSITRATVRLKTSGELKAAIAALEKEQREIDEDIAKCLARVVELRWQIKNLL
ncbi:hypothetical protein CC1G_15764 [Coprinopsis cinerea okayama7|uniref:Uncharacterized protein n=1 Tax=Coprinopsis cinerea (strain Okayama-7 / 130 / ATCC MYA-4618 / FGSC 9003) TaxID=240176 RepID=D6RQX8_COPC7|nr:hypothetical protein CC1G_15764 [Coprinopsis cinerea okayama7\|eukprot:XP_002910045.1 hypothetical protein CC1G_15764 [Coprinopsis cinerea okayama7\